MNKKELAEEIHEQCHGGASVDDIMSLIDEYQPAPALREVTEEEIRYAAGHPDAIPPQQINAFVRGAKWMQAAINKK